MRHVSHLQYKGCTTGALKSRFVTLAGNPNSGKTSLFNALTGAYQHVGNYPGVTVERKEGKRHFHGLDLRIMDLPGTYSLATNSLEERVARDVLVTENPDVTVSVVDCSNLERNLYLTVQLLEPGLGHLHRNPARVQRRRRGVGPGDPALRRIDHRRHCIRRRAPGRDGVLRQRR